MGTRCDRSRGTHLVERDSEMHSDTDAVRTARQDLRHRTLDKIVTPLERLIYLASLRDYRSGRYSHDGLAQRFSERVAAAALRFEHVETFRSVAFASLQSMVEQVGDFLRGADGVSAEGLKTWQSLEPYRVVVPVAEDGMAIRIFLSNIKFALAILATEQRLAP